ncbi:hypothetical protein BST61_g1500 [Cercospora zeina]
MAKKVSLNDSRRDAYWTPCISSTFAAELVESILVFFRLLRHLLWNTGQDIVLRLTEQAAEFDARLRNVLCSDVDDRRISASDPLGPLIMRVKRQLQVVTEAENAGRRCTRPQQAREN